MYTKAVLRHSGYKIQEWFHISASQGIQTNKTYENNKEWKSFSNFPDAYKLLYILAESTSLPKSNWRTNRVQNALWGYYDAFISAARTANAYSYTTPSSGSPNSGSGGAELISEANSFMNYRKNYDKGDFGIYNGELKDEASIVNIDGVDYWKVGPLDIDYIYGAHGDKVFAKLSGCTIKVDEGNGNIDRNVFDNNNFVFMNGGNTIQDNPSAMATSGANAFQSRRFYIGIKTSAGVDKVKSITFKYRHLDPVEAYFFDVVSTASVAQQKLILLGRASTIVREDSDSVNIDVTLGKPKIVSVKMTNSINNIAQNPSPNITITKPGTLDVDATFRPTPQNQEVRNGDTIIYKIKVYNIGTADGKVGTIKDASYTGLEFLPNHVTNQFHGWYLDGNGVPTTVQYANTNLRKTNGTMELEIAFKVNEDGYKNDKIVNKWDPEVTLKLVTDIKGMVFEDINIREKDGTKADGKYIAGQDKPMKGVLVTLYEKNGNPVVKSGLRNPVETDSNGKYEFASLPTVGKDYYVVFTYNGQKYEHTTYKYDVSKEPGKLNIMSHASEFPDNRRAFNDVYKEISGVVSDTRNINAYTGQKGNIETYRASQSASVRENINLGLIKREEFDLKLTKDVENIDININGKIHNYKYNSRNGENIEIDLRGTDVEAYERSIRREDIEYQGNEQGQGKLEVYVTYKIKVTNQTIGEITGEVTKLLENFDTEYSLVESYMNVNGNKKEVKWTTPVQKNGFMSMETVDFSTGDIQTGQTQQIYVKFRINNLEKLVQEQEKVKDNYCEIGSYKTRYTKAVTYLNGEARYAAGENAGLKDIDSDPSNFDPSAKVVKDFIERTKTNEYKNKSNQDKQGESTEVFQDDADKAPSLTLKLGTEKRVLNGSVWEDEALASKLVDNMRIGNGIIDVPGENLIKGIKVQLWDINRDIGKSVMVDETTTDQNGTYEFRAYIPGDYKVRFIYGSEDTLLTSTNNGRVYTGQDYKSTIFDDSKHNESTYWYTEDNNLSDAKDDLARREDVRKYSETLTNHNAEILNLRESEITEGNKDRILELERETHMFSDTPKMELELEYATKVTELNNMKKTVYRVEKIDLGIIERPYSELTMNKKVKHIKIITSDGQTLFDNEKTTTNLAWENGSHIDAIMDPNLIHGSTLILTYNLEIENTGEIDYVKGGKLDETFYNTGKPSSEATIVKTNAMEVVDYIENNLDFVEEQNNIWEIAKRDQIEMLISKDVAIGSYQTIIKAKDGGILQSQLEPRQKTGAATMILTKVMSINNDQDLLVYDNHVEIIKLSNEAGRRSYTPNRGTSIPGNLDVIESNNLQEADSAAAERLEILPPFGDNTVVYIIIGIASAITLLIGIILIKKVVIKNKKD